MKILNFKHNDITLDVKFSPEENTVWLNQNDMAILFSCSKMNVSKHLKKILLNTPTVKSVVNQKFTTQSDGKTYNINHYNLDIIKEVGYKIKPSLTEVFINWCKEELEKDKYQLLPIQSNIIRFEEDNVVLDVRVSPQQYTVWLSLNQMSVLFDRDKTFISGHIADIFNEKELDESRTTAKNATVQIEGKRTVTRNITYYNLDVIISVGFRVTSNRGIVFRRWAIKTLSQYMIKGYSTDERRIALLEESYLTLKDDVKRVEKRMKAIEDNYKNSSEKEIVFYEGEVFDAYDFFCHLVHKANGALLLIDPYIDEVALSILKNKKRVVKAHIITTHRCKITIEDLNKYQDQYGEINIHIVKPFHDRFLSIDDSEHFLLGSSLNRVGAHFSAVVKLEDKTIIKSLEKTLLEG